MAATIPSGICLHVKCRGVLVTYLQGNCPPEGFLGTVITTVECEPPETAKNKGKTLWKRWSLRGASAFSVFIRGQFITHRMVFLFFLFVFPFVLFLFFLFLFEYCCAEIVSPNWTEFGFLILWPILFFCVLSHWKFYSQLICFFLRAFTF